MKITYSDEGAYSRIWLTGPFWQLAMARRIADAGLYASPVNTGSLAELPSRSPCTERARMCSGHIRRWPRPWQGLANEPGRYRTHPRPLAKAPPLA